jgi:hypothetical protein
MPVAEADDIVVCDACPVLCRIRTGKTGACDRYGNVDGKLTRLDPIVLTAQAADHQKVVPFLKDGEWDGALVGGAAPVLQQAGGRPRGRRRRHPDDPGRAAAADQRRRRAAHARRLRLGDHRHVRQAVVGARG